MFPCTETENPVFTSKTQSTVTNIPDPDQTTTLEMQTDLAALYSTYNSGGSSMTPSHAHDNLESTSDLETTTVTYTVVDGADNSVTNSVNISTKGKQK